MPSWVWVLIAIAVVAVFAVVVWQALARQRTSRLQQRFGPEYQRTLGSADSRREAEAELQARQERREQLRIVPLSPEVRSRYAAQWQEVQAEFVDAPELAVARADRVVSDVMRDRGYPVENFEQRAADVSVDHPLVVDNYRAAGAITVRAQRGEATTEDLRQAMRHFRSLFEELLDDSSDQPLDRDQAAAEQMRNEPSLKREVTR